MFTGIIEDIGTIEKLVVADGNLHITVTTTITNELKIDQSVAHNGVCLTVVSIDGVSYTVTAIRETLNKTNLGLLKENGLVNIERAMKLGDRLDGHIVQGHVDQVANCIAIDKEDGSWVFTFEYDKNLNNVTIEKGSITVNGVSLTVVNSKLNRFSVAIIPYTFDNTTFKTLKTGDTVNLEFDVIGKYVKRLNDLRN